MFGRFRKTNDPARETDGGAVAVDEPGNQRRRRPTADPAVREQRLAELQATQAGDADTRGLDRERAVTAGRTADGERAVETDRTAESDRFARTERAPVVERDAGGRARSRRRAEDDPGRRRRGHRGGHARPPARPLRRHPLGQRLLRPSQRHRPGRDPAGHRRRRRRGLRPVGDQRRPQGHAPTPSDSAAPSCCWPSSRSPGTAAATSPGAWRASTACDRASACGCGRWSSRAALAIAAVIGGSEYNVLQQLNLPNVAVGDQSLTTGGS